MLVGTLAASACSVDQKKTNYPTSETIPARGQVLTEAEIANLRNYDALMAATSKIEPTATSTLVPSPTQIPQTQELKPQRMEMMSAAQMTAEQSQLIEKYKAELPSILIKLNADPQQVEDLTMYYPIYRAGQDRYGVPWELLWITHQQESTVSRDPNAYTSDCVNCGAIGRAGKYHTDDDVKNANDGLEYLQLLPVRHPADGTYLGDAAEIIWATLFLKEKAGPEKDYKAALYAYCAPVYAQGRYQEFLAMESLLSN